MRRRWFAGICGPLIASVCVIVSAQADDLPAKIDALIVAAEPDAEFGPVCDDAAFVRRIYLDLAGRIPSHAELTNFLADTTPDKRDRLIDALLAGPEYAERMHDLFHAMLMERRGDHAEWSTFLKTSFAGNKPWDQLVREILDPRDDEESLRGAAFFHTRRLEKVGQQETDYPGLTRDVGRLFLGMDLQCAQCHNHLTIDQYKQADFQGLFVVYQNSYIRSDVKFPALGENVLTKKQDFMSVFEKVPMAVGPRIPGGKEFEIATFEKGQEFALPPDKAKNFPGTPKFSGLELIATDLPRPENNAFTLNFVNRLWFVMFGRGLVNPLDQIHLANPPTHPAVLELLRAEAVARKFDVKSLLGALARTQAYQRTGVLPETAAAPDSNSYRYFREKRLSAEQLMTSVLTATGLREFTPAMIDDKVRAAFVKAFANVPTEPEIDFAPSLKSSLFVMNDAIMVERLTPAAGNLTERLQAQTDMAVFVTELYQCVLSRSPNEDEVAFATEYLTKSAQRRPAAVVNLAWALLASTEFCLNH